MSLYLLAKWSHDLFPVNTGFMFQIKRLKALFWRRSCKQASTEHHNIVKADLSLCYSIKETFFSTIRKMMSLYVNDWRVFAVQDEYTVICKVLLPRLKNCVQNFPRKKCCIKQTALFIPFSFRFLFLSFSSFYPPFCSLDLFPHLFSPAWAHPLLPGDTRTSGYFWLRKMVVTNWFNIW